MSTTRLLVLGVVAGHGTSHGYAVHHELVSWGADDWANIKWGSIYHALRQLAKEGKLEALPADDPSGRVDYRLTEAGHTTFLKLLRSALADAGPHADLLAAGLAFLSSLPRAEAIALLEQRLAALEEARDTIAPLVGTYGEWTEPGTEHVPELFGLWHHSADSAATWTAGLIARLRAGAFTMADEPPLAGAEPGDAPADTADRDDGHTADRDDGPLHHDVSDRATTNGAAEMTTADAAPDAAATGPAPPRHR